MKKRSYFAHWLRLEANCFGRQFKPHANGARSAHNSAQSCSAAFIGSVLAQLRFVLFCFRFWNWKRIKWCSKKYNRSAMSVTGVFFGELMMFFVWLSLETEVSHSMLERTRYKFYFSKISSWTCIFSIIYFVNWKPVFVSQLVFVNFMSRNGSPI